MTQSLDTTLTEAYELIEANRIDEAQAMLRPLLSDYPDDPDLWWVYAHAVDDPAEARRALENVKRLNSETYPEADELLQQLGGEPAPSGGIRRLSRPAPPAPPDMLPPAATDTNSFDDFDDDFDMEMEMEAGEVDAASASSSGRGGGLLAIIGALIFGALIIGVVLFFALFRPDPQPDPTAVAGATVVLATTDPAGSLGVPDGTSIVATEDVLQPATEISVTQAPTTAVTAEDEATTATEPTTVAFASTATTEETPGGALGNETVEATDFNAQGLSTFATEEVSTAESTEPVTAAQGTDVTDADATEDVTEEPSAMTMTTDEPGVVDVMTEEASAATEEMEATGETPTETPTETELPPTETPTSSPTAEPDPEAAAQEAFDAFTLYPESPFRTVQTPDGDAILATICLMPQDNRNVFLADGMDALVDVPTEFTEDAAFVGVSLFDCERETVVRSVAAPVDVLADYAAGDVDRREFQLTWRPVE